MNKLSDKSKSDALDKIEAIAERAERGEDVSASFTNRHVAKQRVNIDFPLDLLRQIDAECARIGIPRQAWIKMACDERLRQMGAHSGVREDPPPKRHTE
jgi:predicted DNA binding CopG/RHH family protein